MAPKAQSNQSREAIPPLGHVLDFMRLMWAINHVLATTSKRMETHFGITGPQRLVIRIVGRFPNISAGQLAAILHLHPSTLTGILIRLEARGFLVRHSDRWDGRRVRVRLTASGQRLTRPGVGRAETAVRHALADFRKEEIDTAREVLANIARALEGVDARTPSATLGAGRTRGCEIALSGAVRRARRVLDLAGAHRDLRSSGRDAKSALLP